MGLFLFTDVVYRGRVCIPKPTNRWVLYQYCIWRISNDELGLPSFRNTCISNYLVLKPHTAFVAMPHSSNIRGSVLFFPLCYRI
jgi:hypothetical protein